MCNDRLALVVLREYPYPTNGGDKLSAHGYIKSLIDTGHIVDLITFDAFRPQHIDSAFRRVLFLDKPRKFSARKIFDWIFNKKSYMFSRFQDSKNASCLLQFLDGYQYSKILISHSYMSGVLPESYISDHMDSTYIITEVMETFALSAFTKRQSQS